MALRKPIRAAGWPALLAQLVLLACFTSQAEAGPNRCGTAPPSRSPTWKDGFGYHWFDSHGLASRAPDGSFLGYGKIDFDRPSAQVDPFRSNSVQFNAGPADHCAAVGDLGNGRNVGEFPVKRAPAVVRMPWLTRSGNVFKSSAGRTTILRGVDWPYNEEVFEPPYNLRDVDFARIASWGINLLRIRIAGYRSGYLPAHPAEPGYWEHLDQLIAAANRHGIYVLLSTVTGDTENALADNQVYERLKFIQGTSQRRFWLAFESTMFKRYRRWPGVVGFDTINEDDSYPPFIHDRFMMEPAHRDLDAALRAGDRRHIYFQEPSGWSYWGAEYWPGMMNGVDVGDPNRFFCPKWKADGDSASDLKKKDELAQQSRAPMFVCEYWITKTGGDGTVNSQQRAVLSAMDARLVGGVRVLYGPSDGYGTQLSNGREAPWVAEFARPYPIWVGGRIKSIRYDFSRRRLVVWLDLSGRGWTEIFTSARRTYRRGFVASSSSGGRLVYNGTHVLRARGMSWDRRTQRVVLRPRKRAVTLTIAPRRP